jgi:hypothetical protein
MLYGRRMTARRRQPPSTLGGAERGRCQADQNRARAGARSLWAMKEISEFDRVADITFSVGAARGLIGYHPLAKQIGMRQNYLGGRIWRVCEQSAAAGGARWSALCVSAQTRQPLRHRSLAPTWRPEYERLSDPELRERECQRCYDAAPAEQPVMAAVSNPTQGRPEGNSAQERTRSC